MNGDDASFDLQAAWLRHFQADAEGRLRAFALRLHEAMPERVTLQEHKGLFSRSGRITGVAVDMDQHRFILELAGGRLRAKIAMVVRGIALNTKDVDPAEWFRQLSEQTRATSEHARRLAQTLSAFMSS